MNMIADISVYGCVNKRAVYSNPFLHTLFLQKPFFLSLRDLPTYAHNFGGLSTKIFLLILHIVRAR